MMNINDLLTKLINMGMHVEYFTPSWDTPFIKVYDTAGYNRNSVADFIRGKGYNCDID